VIRALLVDDEAPARTELRFQLERHRDVVVVGEAARASEARDLIAHVPYDVVFLDIAMPGVSGLELAAEVTQGEFSPPFVVFVTAHDAHALRAFGLSAVDYLLKPVTESRLTGCLERIRYLGARTTVKEQRDPPAFLVCQAGETRLPVKLTDIAFLVAEGDAVFATMTDGRRLSVRRTLRDLEAFLPPEDFLRCHRGYIVNVHQVTEISPYFNGAFMLRVHGTRELLPVSRKRAQALRDRFLLT